MKNITIIDYLPAHQPWFEKLNRHWIEKFFYMEERDIFTLTNPDEAILKDGGAILMAEYDGVIAGTVALRKVDDTTFEFTKMAVDENFRRKGIAEALSQASFKKALQLGAERVILYSHSSLTGAIALYTKLGFHHLLVEDGFVYRRADVKMEMILKTPELSSRASAEISIIRANASHAPVIAGIGPQAFTHAFAHLFVNKTELSEYLDHTYSIPKLRSSLKKESNIFYLVLVNERPVGFVKLKKHSLNEQIDSVSQMELQKIYVLPEFHGSGAGQILMNAAIDRAHHENAGHLWLDVHVDNSRAIHFYEKNGFHIHAKHFFTIGTQLFEYHVMDLELEKPFYLGEHKSREAAMN